MRADSHWYGAVRRGREGELCLECCCHLAPAPGGVAPQLFSGKRDCTASRDNCISLLEVQTMRYLHDSLTSISSLLSLSICLYLSRSSYSEAGPVLSSTRLRSSIDACHVLPSRRVSLIHRGGSSSSNEAGLFPPSRLASVFPCPRRCPCFAPISLRGDALWPIAFASRRALAPG